MHTPGSAAHHDAHHAALNRALDPHHAAHHAATEHARRFHDRVLDGLGASRSPTVRRSGQRGAAATRGATGPATWAARSGSSCGSPSSP
jgi:hypothetical protein